MKKFLTILTIATITTIYTHDQFVEIVRNRELKQDWNKKHLESYYTALQFLLDTYKDSDVITIIKGSESYQKACNKPDIRASETDKQMIVKKAIIEHGFSSFVASIAIIKFEEKLASKDIHTLSFRILTHELQAIIDYWYNPKKRSMIPFDDLVIEEEDGYYFKSTNELLNSLD